MNLARHIQYQQIKLKSMDPYFNTNEFFKILYTQDLDNLSNVLSNDAKLHFEANQKVYDLDGSSQIINWFKDVWSKHVDRKSTTLSDLKQTFNHLEGSMLVVFTIKQTIDGQPKAVSSKQLFNFNEKNQINCLTIRKLEEHITSF